MKISKLAFVLLLAFGLFTFPGCGSDGNTVIEHSGEEPTAEDIAEYEAEQAEMEAERN